MRSVVPPFRTACEGAVQCGALITASCQHPLLPLSAAQSRRRRLSEAPQLQSGVRLTFRSRRQDLGQGPLGCHRRLRVWVNRRHTTHPGAACRGT